MAVDSGAKKSGFGLRAIAPGILVAATGVGAGDLLIASLAGSALGIGILWAAVAGGWEREASI